MADDSSSVGLVEEILEQQSAHALKLSHIDEAISELKISLQHLAAAMALQGTQVMEAGGSKSSEHTIDSVERETASLRSRLSLMLGVMGLQTLLLCALILFAFRPMPRAPEMAPAPATPVAVEAPKPEVAPAPTGDVPLVDPFAGSTGEKQQEKVEKPTKKRKKK